MATVLEQVKIVLGIESKGFSAVSGQIKNLHQGVERNVSTLKNTIAGYLTIAAGKELVGAVSRMAERWKDISEQTGLSTDAVQKYDAAFKKVGLSAEDAAAAFEILTQKRKEALEEGGASAQLFRAFGISEQELRGLTSGASIFERLARGRSAGSQGDRELFGQMFGTKRGGKVLAGANSLNEGGEISLMKAEDIKALDDASKRFEAAARDFKVAASPLVAALLEHSSVALKFWGGNKDGDKQAQMAAIRSFSEDLNGVSFVKWLLKKKDPRADEFIAKSDAMRGGNVLHNSYDDPAVRELIDGGASVDQYSVDKKRAKDKLNESVFSTLFKAGNTGQQKTLLNQQMKEILGQADAEKDPVKKAELQGKAFGLAGNLADLNRQQSGMFAPDSLAAVGGVIGGAGIAADPGLNVATSQLEELRSIAGGVQDLKRIWEESPMKDLR